MKILVIDPNSDAAMIRAIARFAQAFAAGAFDFESLSSPRAPKFIETYEDELRSARL